MKVMKRNVILLIIFCILLIVVGVILGVFLFSDKNKDIFNIDNNNDIISSDDAIINDDIGSNNKEHFDNTNILDNYNEEDVVKYFENLEQEVESSVSFKEKFKDYFVTIVDFIFYDGEIKGYTFDMLTGTAKAKVIAIALKIDTKIDEYVPGYKENISSTAGKVYTDIKEKLVTSYMDISATICEDSKEECNAVKEIFSDVKDYCKIGWDFIKGLFKNGFTKIKDWYEVYSGK